MSFSPQSEYLAKQIIESEYMNSVINFGEKFHSLHEGYAVLLEEVEEVQLEVEKLSADLAVLWNKIKSNEDIKYLTHHMEGTISYVIQETAQVGAVLKKLQNTLEEECNSEVVHV